MLNVTNNITLPVRPDSKIFDYHHFAKSLKSPHFVLPSIFQLVKRKPWPNNMYYVKLDFTAAFFNIPLKDSSKFVTTFIYNDIRYYLNRLPFGLSISPFVFQRFLNSIVNEFKKQSEHVWAHIHDILIAHESKEVLNSIVKNLLEKLIIVDWKINIKKSVLKPTKNLIFLGAIWNFNGITRTKDVTTKLKLLWRALIYIKATSENQIIKIIWNQPKLRSQLKEFV